MLASEYLWECLERNEEKKQTKFFKHFLFEVNIVYTGLGDV